ncbi:hypothetical protein MTR_2g071725 [Medicago truncatula]|uniref:Uncharacterized protein n=1 Tax=Medicago truncatula TaxID=3880 RepID=A0A072VJY1_MEDTR|nr:hypothetical protein MTR_2g071725 [Medicago truncatula]
MAGMISKTKANTHYRGKIVHGHEKTVAVAWVEVDCTTCKICSATIALGTEHNF